ncbi:MAG TPA: glycine cleavage system aminomethyltransferase GcvT, partial [Terriglobia bacterium]|nr:glycine cleavage system aminomethyltransferase GcvT [Terriglobia bacterium]
FKRTALYAAHREAGARIVEFGGWEMPVEYSGIIEEHLAVRTRAGLFDVSHMGEIEVRGPRALALLQHLTSNDVSRLRIYQAQYSALMYPQGSAVDDCVIHRLGEDHFFICVNAANTDKDFEYIRSHNPYDASEIQVRNVSAEYSQLALQGPASAAILNKVTDAKLAELKYYWCCPANCCGVKGLLARTGYTGEDGFEFYFPPSESEKVWKTLLDAGRGESLIPAGLGARNTLRLEAAYPLYGHELDAETTLLEANLGWICNFEKGPFIGREALVEEKRQGLRKKLVGFEMVERGIARDGYSVLTESKGQGRVTSGSYAPYLKKNIGLAYIPPQDAEPGRNLEIEIRGKRVRAQQVALPFYKRPRNPKINN